MSYDSGDEGVREHRSEHKAMMVMREGDCQEAPV